MKERERDIYTEQYLNEIGHRETACMQYNENEFYS